MEGEGVEKVVAEGETMEGWPPRAVVKGRLSRGRWQRRGAEEKEGTVEAGNRRAAGGGGRDEEEEGWPEVGRRKVIEADKRRAAEGGG